MRKFGGWIAVLIVLFSACAESETCRTNKDIGINIGFYSFENRRSMSIDSISITNIETGELMIDNAKNVRSVSFPLNPNAELSTYTLTINEIENNLELYYSNTEYFISYICGMIITHELDSIAVHSTQIMDVQLTNPLIQPNDAEHVQIYF